MRSVSPAGPPLARRSLLRAVFGGLGSALIPPTLSEALARPVPDPDTRAVVETTSGRVRGLVADGIHIFRGIPFGAPTGGRDRFKPPRPAIAWAGVRNAIDYGDMAPQQVVTLGGSRSIPVRDTMNLIPVFSTSQSEDCLNLNIWTPGVNGAGKRPVMVWLHPGGFEFGNANLAFNEGTNLARRGDVVVVSINQRLGVLGHLHLGALAGPQYARAGNVGMLDILLALQWVRDNIAGFGGDPDCVMIHGESGGARKVSTLLAMPGAKGLFHRAAIQSGPGIRFPSNDTQTKRARYVFEELALRPGDVGGLIEVPASSLVAAGVKAAARVKRETPSDAPFYENYGFTPMLGTDLPNAPFDPVAPAVSADVPVLIGSNRHELSLAYTQDPRFDSVDEAALLSEARARAGDAAPDLVRIYRDENPQTSLRDLLLILTADFSHRKDSIALAERKAEQRRASVYMYRFDWEAPVLDGLIKAAHTFEIPHVFDNTQLCSGMTGGGPDALALAARMSAAWIAFARTGDPSIAELPQWPRYDTKRRATMLFNDRCELARDPGERERKAWRRIEMAQRGRTQHF